MSDKYMIKGTLLLTITGLLSRFLGFFYKIFLSRAIGAHGLGVYQLILPLQTLMIALGFSGVYSAISKLCSARLALKKDQDSHRIFLLGTFFSASASGLLGVLLYQNASFFANLLLKEPLTEPLLKLLSFSFLPSAIHNCVNNYCFSHKHTVFPSVLQFIEQVIRVGSCYLIFLIQLSKGNAITPSIAVFGTLISELLVALICIFYVNFYFSGYRKLFQMPEIFSDIRVLFSMAIPLSLNRISLTVLGCVETILIPQMLKRHGLSSNEALSLYGIFTGMTLPLLLFPSALIHSLSVLLLPSVSQLHTLGAQQKILALLKKILLFSMGLGFFCTAFFFLFGRFIGLCLFHDTLSGTFLQMTSFLCPFLYSNILFASVLNGIGKPKLCLMNNLISILLRIFFVIFILPIVGIKGYFLGIFSSELLLTLLNLNSFYISYRQ